MTTGAAGSHGLVKFRHTSGVGVVVGWVVEVDVVEVDVVEVDVVEVVDAGQHVVAKHGPRVEGPVSAVWRNTKDDGPAKVGPVRAMRKRVTNCGLKPTGHPAREKSMLNA